MRLCINQNTRWRDVRLPKLRTQGFTLAELLIALLILGVIATFTIPKVLTAQNNARYNAIAKEAAATLSGAYQAYELDGGTKETFYSTTDLQKYLNYVKILTDGSEVDGVDIGQQEVCTANPNFVCAKLHNGAILYWWGMSFCDTSDKSAIWVRLDPDGVPDDRMRAATVFLYSNGRITSIDGLDNPTRWGYGWPTCVDHAVADPGSNPSWFRWD